MGNIRVPKPIYFENGVINFYTQGSIVKYNIYIWNNNGMTQIAYKSGIYLDNAKELIDDALHKFTNVMENKN